MVGRLARLFSLLLLGWFAFLAGAAVYAKAKGRDSVTPEPDADEIDLVATFGPMEYHSTAGSFRGGTVTTWFGGGTLDLRNATLDPAGATISGKSPLRPQIDAAHPFAARTPHFTAPAKRVVVIFCSGACSHVDTFDYKPELIARHGQPLPGADKLITFQGEQGNITQSPWKFRPRGECGVQVGNEADGGGYATKIEERRAALEINEKHAPAIGVARRRQRQGAKEFTLATSGCSADDDVRPLRHEIQRDDAVC